MPPLFEHMYLPFPTGVGMNRDIDKKAAINAAVPHRRGDEPQLYLRAVYAITRSPQAWG